MPRSSERQAPNAEFFPTGKAADASLRHRRLLPVNRLLIEARLQTAPQPVTSVPLRLRKTRAPTPRRGRDSQLWTCPHQAKPTLSALAFSASDTRNLHACWSEGFAGCKFEFNMKYLITG